MLGAWLQIGPRNCALTAHKHNKRRQGQPSNGMVGQGNLCDDMYMGVFHACIVEGRGMRTWLTLPSPTHTGIENSSSTTCRHNCTHLTLRRACCSMLCPSSQPLLRLKPGPNLQPHVQTYPVSKHIQCPNISSVFTTAGLVF